MLKRIALIAALIISLSCNSVAFASEEATTSTEVQVVEDTEKEDESKVSWKTVVMLIIVGCGAIDVYLSGQGNKGDSQND